VSDARTVLETAQTVLFVHAHPDDETLSTGGLIADLVARGARPVVLTCTRGERGEVVEGPLKPLEGTVLLADHRERELAQAMRTLGVVDHRFLGALGARAAGLPPRTYTDSGMRWGADGRAEAGDDADDEALSIASLDEVAADVAAVIDAVSPELVVSYDAGGGYGHPDHVRAHDAAVVAAAVRGVPFAEVVGELASGGSDVVTLDLAPYLELKRAAMAAHASQLTLTADGFVLSGGQHHVLHPAEYYRLAGPSR
jgi:N-acetyl-1-D-myo-inositol-2-amino-2-deoxy-alpha-D-glucopyranoside deacetylase